MNDIAALFIAAPLTIIPLLDRNARMDMVDLYDAGQTARVGNRYGGESELTALSDSVLTIGLTEVSGLRMELLPDSTLCMEHTVTTADSTKHTLRRFYTHDFKEMSK